MNTLFECWNGGTVQWNRMSPPQFVFGFPAVDPELVRFFQLSGRIGEVLTGADWHLNIGGQLFDIPNFPPNEIAHFNASVRDSMGYMAIPVTVPVGDMFNGFVPVTVGLWANLSTGRTDVYNPFVGSLVGQQHFAPQMLSFSMPPPQTVVTSNGEVQQGGALKLIENLASIIKGAGQIADCLSQFTRSS